MYAAQYPEDGTILTPCCFQKFTDMSLKPFARLYCVTSQRQLFIKTFKSKHGYRLWSCDGEFTKLQDVV